VSEKCPYCGFEAETVQDEVAHMSERHHDIVHDRLREAGYTPDEIEEIERRHEGQ
jgi:hypothetical protein